MAVRPSNLGRAACHFGSLELDSDTPESWCSQRCFTAHRCAPFLSAAPIFRNASCSLFFIAASLVPSRAAISALVRLGPSIAKASAWRTVSPFGSIGCGLCLTTVCAFISIRALASAESLCICTLSWNCAAIPTIPCKNASCCLERVALNRFHIRQP